MKGFGNIPSDVFGWVNVSSHNVFSSYVQKPVIVVCYTMLKSSDAI